jgi:hypothetical protein
VSTTLTYDGVLSRVQVVVTGLNVATDVVTIERSTNQVNWTTVRGGGALVPSGNSVHVDDYEFSANVQNFYRIRAYDTTASTYVTGGPPVSGNNSSLVATLPIGYQAGDLMLIEASIRNSGTGQPNVPTGYTTVMDASNVKLFGRIVTGGSEPTPTVSFTGGVANADTLVQTAAFRNTSLTVGNVATQLNSTPAQNIDRPALTVPFDRMMLVQGLWKQDDWTSVSAGTAGWNAIQGNGTISTAGDDAAMSWSYMAQTTKTDIAVDTATVSGGSTAISRSFVVAFLHADLLLSSEIVSITPTITTTWIKVIARPFLNRPLGCIPNISSIKRRARNGIFVVVGRNYPIAVTDVRGSKELVIDVITRTTTERTDFDIILATGDTFFFQAPPGDPMPTLYAAVQDTDERRPLRNRDCDNDWRVFNLPLIEIAAPSADIVGALGTWQTVVNTYATWSDVLANHVDWASLLTLVGSTNDVIVS